ncbi:AMP-binding protein [Arthrobacter oryzae]|uniref:AMP-dependent synthetase n=1 Tax=Arthrobacter oryzae TaxID=409290 RepID=A0A3N0BTH4_9MICC|nr:AMP-binding protein [Arthrobacter oryzae]RNL52045.1 AMP-dependent synthetase [Arthrobacter oryzae]
MTIQLDLARVPFAADLARYGDSPAILTRSGILSYQELADRVTALARRLGPVRRLVALAAANDVDSLVAYLAALESGHPLIVVPADKPSALDAVLSVYDPDVVLRSRAGAAGFDERRPGTAHELHPDLALLLSTSGSTGSPKLVRLSHANVQSNAEAIADYLGIGPGDRAATTLPMSYSYGLSVINSHLLRGAGLVLTEHSVVDPCFWDLFRSAGATSFAAVPYTFELLERVGFAGMDLPGLRYVTQAGGRLDPDTVHSFAELGRRRGWNLFVMYGATEATARMAYLPPDLATTVPQTIGIPVPGGSFRIDPVPGLEHGELVYTGPNVMLGYAEDAGDLAAGRTIGELRTGDLARLHPAGVYEIVGRRSRFVKIVGLRVDLGRIEQILADLGAQSACAGNDAGLVVAVEGDHDTALLGKVLAQDAGLPRASVALHAVDSLPRLSTGKIDYPAVLALGLPASTRPAPVRGAGTAGPVSVRTIFAETLECPDIGDDDTFVSLGGDSLSYVAASVRLEQALGHLPANWHVTPVKDLQPHRRASRTRRLFAPIETSIVLRAAAIVCIISTHVGLFHWQGTAHVLMAVAGYNFARFQVSGERSVRLRRQLSSVARIVVPSVAFIAVAYLVTDHYSPANILLLNAVLGPEEVTTQWHFWFVEVLVYLLVAVTALLAIPWADLAERRYPLLFPLALTGAGLLTRFEVLDPGVPHTAPVLWIFALGWAIARARTAYQRCALSIVAVLTVPGYFQDVPREWTLLLGILLLIWVPVLPVPAGLRRLTAVLASSSLFAYLVHWLVYPPLAGMSPALAVAASLAAGAAYWALTMRATAALGRRKFRIGRRRSSEAADRAVRA